MSLCLVPLQSTFLGRVLKYGTARLYDVLQCRRHTGLNRHIVARRCIVDGNATAMSSDPSSAAALIRRWFDEVWNLWDQIGMARQLGILEGKAAQLFS